MQLPTPCQVLFFCLLFWNCLTSIFFLKKTLWQFNNCEKEQKLEESLFSNENTRGMLIREKLLQKSVNLEVDDLFYFMYKYLCLEYMDG